MRPPESWRLCNAFGWAAFALRGAARQELLAGRGGASAARGRRPLPARTHCWLYASLWLLEAEGYEGLANKPKSGRPKVSIPQQDADIVASVSAEPLRAAISVVRELHPEQGEPSKRWAVHRR
ncbi:Hypothetical predicted protein [Olea europaea subsp. europaea]|uniref:Uncharacterized protein n=1 Tax=Olea europaea subsp. europaea TaxID=158383 RepID=A0A8S0TGS3_OLEEU|nr:Hypothetical predicted protein [Olea europaea subsp. europaea]